MFSFSLPRISVAAVSALAGVTMLGGAAFAWSGHVEGQPASFQAGGTDGYYFWHTDAANNTGFHLRTTDSARVYKYSGTLYTNGQFDNVELIRAEKDDRVAVVDAGHEIKYQLVTAEGIDGIDFTVGGGSRVVLWLDRDGHRIDPADIFLGEDGGHPAHDPFSIHRTRDTAHPWASKGGTVEATAAPTPAGG
ncbi:MAG TPA: hypothetical protein VNL16_06915 [Chloroflexota bacterium]|nr:hypothetical protein [Chloroflexota bacterium]